MSLINQENLSKILKNRKLFISLIMVFILLVIAAFANIISPFGYEEINTGPRLTPPDSNNLFGTDHFGRDLFSRVILGTRYSLLISVVVVIFSNIIGISIGVFSGYLGGKVDLFVMRIVDTIFTIPWVLIAMMVALFMGRGVQTVIIALSIIYSPQIARIVRGSTLSIKEKEFVQTGKISGDNTLSIISRYILPNAMGPIIVQSTMILASSMLAEAALSYLGYGVSPPTPSWGLLLQDASKYYTNHDYLVYFPGLAIVFTVLTFSFLGDGLRDQLDPKFVPL